MNDLEDYNSGYETEAEDAYVAPINSPVPVTPPSTPPVVAPAAQVTPVSISTGETKALPNIGSSQSQESNLIPLPIVEKTTPKKTPYPPTPPGSPSTRRGRKDGKARINKGAPGVKRKISKKVRRRSDRPLEPHVLRMRKYRKDDPDGDGPGTSEYGIVGKRPVGKDGGRRKTRRALPRRSS